MCTILDGFFDNFDDVRRLIPVAPTARQWDGLRLMAAEHGHWWGCEWDLGALVDLPPQKITATEVKGLLREPYEDEWVGIQPTAAHTTQTGRTFWAADREDGIVIIISRPAGPVFGVRLEWAGEWCVAEVRCDHEFSWRHVQALRACLAPLGVSDADIARVLARESSGKHRLWIEGDDWVYYGWSLTRPSDKYHALAKATGLIQGPGGHPYEYMWETLAAEARNCRERMDAFFATGRAKTGFQTLEHWLLGDVGLRVNTPEDVFGVGVDHQFKLALACGRIIEAADPTFSYEA